MQLHQTPLLLAVLVLSIIDYILYVYIIYQPDVTSCTSIIIEFSLHHPGLLLQVAGNFRGTANAWVFKSAPPTLGEGSRSPNKAHAQPLTPVQLLLLVSLLGS